MKKVIEEINEINEINETETYLEVIENNRTPSILDILCNIHFTSEKNNKSFFSHKIDGKPFLLLNGFTQDEIKSIVRINERNKADRYEYDMIFHNGISEFENIDFQTIEEVDDYFEKCLKICIAFQALSNLTEITKQFNIVDNDITINCTNINELTNTIVNKINIKW